MSLCFNCQHKGKFWFTKKQCVCIFNLIQQGLGYYPTFDQVVAYIVASGQNPQNLLQCIPLNPKNIQRVPEGYEGDTNQGLRRLALVIALYMVLGGLIRPQQGRTVGDHFNQLVHLQHTQLATPTPNENVHFITREHPVGKWMCAFTKDYLEINKGTEEDDNDYDDDYDYDDLNAKVKKAKEIFRIVRDEYLSSIDRDTDSKTLLESVPVYHIDRKLRDSCFPEGNPSVALHTQAALRCEWNDVVCKTSMQNIANQVDRLGPFRDSVDGCWDALGCFGKHRHQQNSTEPQHRQGPIVLVSGGLCEDNGTPFEAVLLHELIHAIHARVQIVQRILSGFDYDYQHINTLVTGPWSQTNTKLLEVAKKFARAASVLLSKIYERDADWGKAFQYTKDYWLSDVEMVPHLATVSLAVQGVPIRDKSIKGLLFGPAVQLYNMYIEYPDIQPHFKECFVVLEEMKKIPTDGLHDGIPGLKRTPINYESMGAADHPALRWIPG